MPSPGTKPPTKRVDQLKSEITTEMWEKYNKEGSKTASELHRRDTKMITDLIEQLAEAKALIENYEVDVE